MTRLEVESLSVNYGPIEAIRDISFSVEEGTITTIIGPNGAGKTTTLKTISGLRPVRAGKIVFVGHELTPAARSGLLDGTMAAVINQDAGHEIRSALRLATARLTREPVHADQERIRIDIYLKDNLP